MGFHSSHLRQWAWNMRKCQFPVSLVLAWQGKVNYHEEDSFGPDNHFTCSTVPYQGSYLLSYLQAKC